MPWHRSHFVSRRPEIGSDPGAVTQPKTTTSVAGPAPPRRGPERHVEFRRAGSTCAWRQYAAAVERRNGTSLLGVFEALREWFETPDFRGCAFINAHAELGWSSPAAAEIVASHKRTLSEYLGRLARAEGVSDPDVLARRLLLLVDGAIVTASIQRDSARRRRRPRSGRGDDRRRKEWRLVDIGAARRVAAYIDVYAFQADESVICNAWAGERGSTS